MIEVACEISNDLTKLYQQKLKAEIKTFANENSFTNYSIGRSINTILIGESHKTYDNELLAFIKTINPGLLIHEGFTAYEFNPKYKILHLQKGRVSDKIDEKSWEDLLQGENEDRIGRMPFLQLASELSIPILGADFTLLETMTYLQETYPKSTLDMLNDTLIADEAQYIYLLDALTKDMRDEHMLNLVKNNLGNETSPTIVILGFMHTFDMAVRGGLNNVAFIEAIPDEIRDHAHQKYYARKKDNLTKYLIQ